MNHDIFTLERIEGALEELEMLMAACDDGQLVLFAALYAKAYTIKLNLMAKENKHAGR